MEEEYRIERVHRTCGRCGREFRDGEPLFTAILPSPENRFIRQDYCEPCWSPDPSRVFSYWRSEYPTRSKPSIEDMSKVQRFFDRLLRKQEEGLEGVTFFTALVLVRKKKLRLLGTRSEGTQEWLRLEKVWDGERVEILDPGIEEAQIDKIRRDMERLFEMELAPA